MQLGNRSNTLITHSEAVRPTSVHTGWPAPLKSQNRNETNMPALLSPTRLEDLANHNQSESISVVMPTQQSGRQVQQNAIRFKNLLNEVVARFVSMGTSEHAAEERIAALREYQRDNNFWQHQSEGLALYFCDGQVSTLHLQHAPEPMVTIADHYFITPVAADSSKSQPSSVLTVTWEEAKLYDSVQGRLEPHDCKQFPVGIRDVVLPPDAEEQLQVRTRGGGGNGMDAGMFHGQGEGEQMIESDRKRFLAEVGRRLEDVFNRSLDNLIIIGTDEVIGHLKATTELSKAKTLTASPASMDQNQLSKRVEEFVSGEPDVGCADRIEHLGNAIAHGKGSKDLTEIIRAALEGRVSDLFINPHQRIWGCWNADTQTASIVEEQSNNGTSVELVNLAVVLSLRTGAQVVASIDSQLGQEPAAAIFRY